MVAIVQPSAGTAVTQPAVVEAGDRSPELVAFGGEVGEDLVEHAHFFCLRR